LKSIHLICVGRLKDKHLESLENDYLKRINSPSLQIHEVKASAENMASEAECIIRKIKEIGDPYFCVALTERGRHFDSFKFSQWLQDLLIQHQKIIFIISGAEGFDPSALAYCHFQLSLSELTFPHKIARILMVEQIYRAQTIRTKHPYHN
jgi:23S rRNA (pseudouridine1915-N3)-methyltransferase